MADICVGNDGNDIVLQNGDYCLTSDTNIAEGIRQDVKARLLTFEGEYFLDLSGNQVGVPWIQTRLQKPGLDEVDSIIRAFIEDTPGVSSVESLLFNFTRSDRKMEIQFTALTNAGSLVQDNIVGLI